MEANCSQVVVIDSEKEVVRKKNKCDSKKKAQIKTLYRLVIFCARSSTLLLLYPMLTSAVSRLRSLQSPYARFITLL